MLIYVTIQLISFILMSAVAYGRAASFLTTPSSVIGITACGLILFGVAVVGLVGVVRHDPCLLFVVSLLAQATTQ